MGPSNKLLFFIGSVFAALIVIIGFRTLLSIKDAGHGPPMAGYELPKPDDGGEAAPAASAEGGADKPTEKAAKADAGSEPTTESPAVVEAKTGPAGGANKSSGFDPTEVVAMIASANVKKGGKLFRRCAACHSYKKGDAAMLGPNLWGVVGRDIASEEGFEYSSAMKSQDGNWTLEALAKFVNKPKRQVPGTKMIFTGISKTAKLADLLAHLVTLSDNPAPVQ